MRKTLQQIRFLIALAALFVSSLAGAGTMTYFHNDLAGSPVAATNASGQVIWKERYRPYGERIVNSPASADNEVWFTSRRQDVDTGLVYMGARYYDPVVGRFISTDPKQFDGQDGRTFNRYAYAANNPLKFIDPDGRKFEFVAGSTDAFKRDVAAMRFYLELGGVAATLQTIDNRAETIYLQQGATDVMEYRGESKTIVIDSSSALRVGDGMVQTPALGLLHEAGHALHDLEDHKQFLLNIRTPDTAFDNKEERNVIENIENPAARTLKEPTRADHSGTPVQVVCPSCIQ